MCGPPSRQLPDSRLGRRLVLEKKLPIWLRVSQKGPSIRRHLDAQRRLFRFLRFLLTRGMRDLVDSNPMS